jgi:hypothetical protein
MGIYYHDYGDRELHTTYYKILSMPNAYIVAVLNCNPKMTKMTTDHHTDHEPRSATKPAVELPGAWCLPSLSPAVSLQSRSPLASQLRSRRLSAALSFAQKPSLNNSTVASPVCSMLTHAASFRCQHFGSYSRLQLQSRPQPQGGGRASAHVRRQRREAARVELRGAVRPRVHQLRAAAGKRLAG